MPVPADVLTETTLADLPEDPFTMLGLIRAAARGEAEPFAVAAAALTRGPVMLLDSDGTVVAFSASPEHERADDTAAPAEIALRDEAGLWGTLTLTQGPSGASCPQGSMLAELGLALVKTLHSERTRATRESQLVVLSCLTGRGTPTGSRKEVALRIQELRLVMPDDSGRADREIVLDACLPPPGLGLPVWRLLRTRAGRR